MGDFFCKLTCTKLQYARDETVKLGQEEVLKMQFFTSPPQLLAWAGVKGYSVRMIYRIK